MLADIHAGKIRALVIKDFSRFSRDYIEAGNLLENVFPFHGVRFISVADSYDSFETDGSAESLLIPLKNLINSFYSKDMSKKYLLRCIPDSWQVSTYQASFRVGIRNRKRQLIHRLFEGLFTVVTAVLP